MLFAGCKPISDPLPAPAHTPPVSTCQTLARAITTVIVHGKYLRALSPTSAILEPVQIVPLARKGEVRDFDRFALTASMSSQHMLHLPAEPSNGIHAQKLEGGDKERRETKGRSEKSVCFAVQRER